MLQSVPKILKCFTCGSKPHQFIILACDHVICQKCITQNTLHETNKQIYIRCKCGIISLFVGGMIQQVSQQQIIAKFNPKTIQNKQKKIVIQYRQKENDIKPRSLIINQQNHENTSFQNMQFNNTTCQTKEIQSRISYPREDPPNPHENSFNEKSKRNWMSRKTHHETQTGKNNQSGFRLKTCHVNYQQGSPFFENEENSVLDNFEVENKLKKSRKSLQKRKPGQLHFYEIDTEESRISKEQVKGYKQKNKLIQKEIEFIKLVHQKSISDLRESFETNIKKINKQFQEIVSDFKDMITQDLIGNQEQIDWIKYSKLLKKQYNKRLSKKIENMMHMFQKIQNGTLEQQQKGEKILNKKNYIPTSQVYLLNQKDSNSRHSRSSGKLCEYHQYKTKKSYQKFLHEMASNKKLCKKSDPTKIYKFERIV